MGLSEETHDLYGDNTPAKINRLRTFQLSKFDDPTRATMDEDRSTRDAFVFRIAEMYLIAAEALMELDPPKALYYMNQLRENRALPGKSSQMRINSNDLTVDFILDERARELGGEQLRWFDLKRFNEEKFVERIKAGNPDAAGNVKPWHIVRPIPRTQLDAVFNKDEFKQNEGYAQ
ncbi:RagB/SusD family nutrient uptake outer membrane protein [Anaerorudis cellulosivorans]|uniref:RagB/SusD family nutrient uptake outer membrane protein n=1 Tax=Anaerorudis cellulosivorans TaxID=3397862 RepID=UPI00221E4FE8|nr:RagB/SusD family nutrient uptake outer membrane protein [Seramator thermalis]MCW1734427.1 RagB/SusD family nutrient uptake outer membrane protein [Seramator thermalis]